MQKADGFTDFVETGAVALGPRLDPARCANLVTQLRDRRLSNRSVFLAEERYLANPVHTACNPRSEDHPSCGRNLLEDELDDSWIAEDSALRDAVDVILGPGARIINRKLVVAVPTSWIPPWVAERIAGIGVPNLGAYIRPDFRDVTWFHGIDLHQDIVDYRHETADQITIYAYLEDVGDDDSPIVIAPGSHLLGVSTFPHRIEVGGPTAATVRYWDDHARSMDLELHSLRGRAGSLWLWHGCLLHGTRPASGSAPRISVRYILRPRRPLEPVRLMARCNERIGRPHLQTGGWRECRADVDDRGIVVRRQNSLGKIPREQT